MEFRILGPLEVLERDSPLDLGGAKQRMLLATLLLDANRPVATERLIDALWEHEPPETAMKAVQGHVSSLRKVLGKDRIETKAGSYLVRTYDQELDVERFEALVADQRFEEALALWRGPALADFGTDRFAHAEIARLEELRLACLERRIEQDLGRNRHAELVGELEAAVAQHPLRERLRSQLMLALYRCGRHAEALEAYQEARRLLVEELGIEPSAELQALHRAILNQDSSLAPATAHEPEQEQRPSLPAPTNRLIGRRPDLLALSDLLLGEPRLVTVTGAGGSGKTRLVVEVATALAAEFGHQVYFVSLAALREPELVPATLMAALGIKETERPLETLKHSIGTSALLLVVDNFEHLLESAPLLGELLACCPRLKLLVTSRSSLHLSGEHEYPLEPLPLKQAIALFTERARAVRPDYAGDEAVVATICSRLDCLPLALELAAARSRLLSLPELLSRLEHSLELLTGGPSDLASRQQTLEATIAWSYDLLNPEEQRLFLRLAVFAGGCTLDAAERVPGASLDQLQSLVEKSLLRRRESGGEGRFWMLETIREYALERLEAAEGDDATRRVHGNYYVALAQAMAAKLDDGRRSALDAVEQDLDNFRSAFSWAQEADTGAALRLGAALSSSWYARGQLIEGRRWFEAVLAVPHPPSRELALVAAELARLLFFLGETEAAAGRLEHALELAEPLDLPDVLSEALTTKGLLLETAGRHQEALALLERALSVARRHDLAKPLLRALVNTSHLMHAGDELVKARSIDLEALALSGRLDSHAGMHRSLGHLLEADVLLGDWDEALAMAEEIEQRSLPGRLGDSLTGGLPWLHVQRGEIDEARQVLEAHQHLESVDELQARSSYALAQAVVLRAEDRPREALAAASRALTARDTFGARHPIVKLAFVEAVEAAFASDDLDQVSELLGEWERMPPGDRTAFVEAHHSRFVAQLAARRGEDDAVEPGLRRATALFRELSMPFYVALTLLDHGDWLAAHDHPDEAEPLFAEAREVFERLQAKRWLEQATRLEFEPRTEGVPSPTVP
jgi:predicted ATPase/DNA-binding SARP family transcriptional activator